MSATLREEQGTVLQVAGGVAQIRVEPSEACGTCSLRGRCHEDATGPVVEVPVADLAVGDAVIIRKRSASRLLLALLVYTFPVVTLVVGALVGNDAGGDSTALVGAAVGLAIGVLAVVIVGRIGTARGWWHVTVEHAPAVQVRVSPS